MKKNLRNYIKNIPSLNSDLLSLVKELEKNPQQGTPLGKDFYKIRLTVTSKGKGKSGGAGVINLRENISGSYLPGLNL